LKNFERYRVLVLPDHPTPLSTRTHAADPVPYVIYSSEKEVRNDSVEGFDEVTARKSQVLIEKGFELIEKFLKTQSSN
jgi:2,3-bisphosphoglycerate-independent phosphoglycerate mutase